MKSSTIKRWQQQNHPSTNCSSYMSQTLSINSFITPRFFILVLLATHFSISNVLFLVSPVLQASDTHTHNVESIVPALARTAYKHSSINVTNLFAFSSPNIFLLLESHKPNHQHFTKTIISDNKLPTLTQRRDCCEKRIEISHV